MRLPIHSKCISKTVKGIVRRRTNGITESVCDKGSEIILFMPTCLFFNCIRTSVTKPIYSDHQIFHLIEIQFVNVYARERQISEIPIRNLSILIL